MKYLKKYEKNDNVPQVGDYVICEEEYLNDKYIKLYQFIKNNIGIIYKYNPNEYEYVVEYKNIPSDLNLYFQHYKKGCRIMGKKEIIAWSKNKKDLEIELISNKYNL